MNDTSRNRAARRVVGVLPFVGAGSVSHPRPSPHNGVARAEQGIDFIQEVQVQSVGASAEFGNAQGAVINVVTRQGSARLLYDVSCRDAQATHRLTNV